MASLLAEGGLLAGFFFFATTPKGPPFGIERTELDALLAPHFELIEDEPVADSIAVFAGQRALVDLASPGGAGLIPASSPLCTQAAIALARTPIPGSEDRLRL